MARVNLLNLYYSVNHLRSPLESYEGAVLDDHHKGYGEGACADHVHLERDLGIVVGVGYFSVGFGDVVVLGVILPCHCWRWLQRHGRRLRLGLEG